MKLIAILLGAFLFNEAVATESTVTATQSTATVAKCDATGANRPRWTGQVSGTRPAWVGQIRKDKDSKSTTAHENHGVRRCTATGEKKVHDHDSHSDNGVRRCHKGEKCTGVSHDSKHSNNGQGAERADKCRAEQAKVHVHQAQARRRAEPASTSTVATTPKC